MITLAVLLVCALIFVGLAVWESRDGHEAAAADIDRYTRAARARAKRAANEARDTHDSG